MLDEKQNWKLLSASEDETYTYLKFTRTLDTCDPEDIAITVAKTRLCYDVVNSNECVVLTE